MKYQCVNRKQCQQWRRTNQRAHTARLQLCNIEGYLLQKVGMYLLLAGDWGAVCLPRRSRSRSLKFSSRERTMITCALGGSSPLSKNPTTCTHAKQSVSVGMFDVL